MKKYISLFLFASCSLLLSAQETDATSVDINLKTNESWYASPWIWIVGAALFILLLVALTRGRRNG